MPPGEVPTGVWHVCIHLHARADVYRQMFGHMAASAIPAPSKGPFFVLASWIISLLFSLPQVYIFSLREVGDGVFDCWGDFVQPWGAKAYVTWISLTIYIIPVAILSVCYGLISFKIWQNFKLKTRRDQCLSLTPRPAKNTALSRVSSVKLISKAKIRTVKMTFVIVLAYIICWTPFFFVQMWSAWDPTAPREGNTECC